ncbi:MAG: LemA family protein [Candidatus Shapirobacteria bacterium]|nr:LemA family protein [Candidatus Shapirobacteria bacterium]MDD5073725.1 LemA family protein [Candidatus Shapirobacteria bacterium]MDD5481714.1 LemA family protein [Candidatus Shapirobacteria bacterium]
MILVIVLLGVLVSAAAYIAVTYNFFVVTKTRIQAQMEELGNQLKRRAEFLPQVADIIAINTDQEKEIYQMITEARRNVNRADKNHNPEELIRAASEVEQAIGSIQVLVESNPELKTAEVVIEAQNNLRDTQDKVMYAKRTLIDLVQSLNARVLGFPSNLVAKMFGFQTQKGLELVDTKDAVSVSQEDMANPKIKKG